MERRIQNSWSSLWRVGKGLFAFYVGSSGSGLAMGTLDRAVLFAHLQVCMCS